MHKSQLMWDLVNRFGMTKKDAKVCVDTVFSNSMADALEEQGRIELPRVRHVQGERLPPLSRPEPQDRRAHRRGGEKVSRRELKKRPNNKA